MTIKYNKRVLTKNMDTDIENDLIIDENKVSYYNELKEKLKSNFKKEIFHKVVNIRILKEIKDNQYYKLDGYKSFFAFVKDFNIARAQAYKYLKLATALQEGLLKEDYVIENGINNSFDFIKDKESPSFKKSKQNPIKPLRFQLKKQESYDFYKSNAKFTGFMLDKLFSDGKEIIKKLMKEYKELKG
ncbi:chromosome replication/partitioning protein [Borreliella burgdorferi]|uniref:chromosome replication/partitioning protein n=1 Tax=Borreliella burgdorferi TaxID=139 RepID=UPI001E57686A|nr:chromosome replication/partitioning protein [Borreliella burgdorferi]MCD2383830.1 chromosome replication/partitioning protein [Borreliella burgdorferi]MCD2384985.1 chromosome replication/partitioning protein [Borreliella burgdorferi]MCD2389987.1 chromosome replication/partitioning protein [Borreliella burgdorferi]MCD2393570.1 chromosome replication/partitioning protein [Borreliella burgdorferi]MCD2394723.1 chromosome replication/partitioning protein [Borreliella burgdorferi]